MLTAVSHDSQPTNADRALIQGIERLADAVKRSCPHDGRFETCVPDVFAIRVSRVNKEPVHAMQRPALCLVAQGAKSVMLRQEVYRYEASQMTIYAVDLPLAAQVTEATASEPYLCFMLHLDAEKLADLALRVFSNRPAQPARDDGGIVVCDADAKIINAAARLLELTSRPSEALLLAQLNIEEILIRLLLSPIGGRVAEIGLMHSKLHNIAKAVSWLRANFYQPIKIEELAALANMSTSSFHQHFKSVTSMSPLQYQKALRLQEARRLMLTTRADIGAVSERVGYLSTSQFSREYARYFGNAPTRDIARLTKHDLTA